MLVHLATKMLQMGRALVLMNLSTSPEAELANTVGLNKHNPGKFSAATGSIMAVMQKYTVCQLELMGLM